MGFNNFFENDNKARGNYSENQYHDRNRNYQNSNDNYGGFLENPSLLNFLEKIRNNKKLKLLVVFAIILIISIAVILLIVLWPFIVKLFNYIMQNGLQGLIDGANGFIDRILNGSGK